MHSSGFLLIAVLATSLCSVPVSSAEPGDGPAEPDADESSTAFDEALDEVAIDVQSSVDSSERITRARKPVSTVLHGDLRLGYILEGEDLQAVRFGKPDVLRLRWRLGIKQRFTKSLKGSLRIAGLCSTENCSPELVLSPEITGRSSMRDGEVTIDTAFLQWFQSERYDLAVGRMETKFVARGGVFSKSMDRNDSNNLRVNWTDGVHATYRGVRGWASHLIIQYNDEDGPSSLRHAPLDFTSDRSRASYYLAFESKKALRRMVQRSITVSYLPASLAKNGLSDPAREDYFGIVGRVAVRWPVREEGWRLRASAELAYATETPEKSAVGIEGTGDADGLAWAATLSIMDFAPRHSIGVNYARTRAGWLLSPQYTPNEELIEARYMFRPTARVTLDIRGRWRYDLDPNVIEIPDRDNFDFYARATWSFEM